MSVSTYISLHLVPGCSQYISLVVFGGVREVGDIRLIVLKLYLLMHGTLNTFGNLKQREDKWHTTVI